jgi:hypothetical protein
VDGVKGTDPSTVTNAEALVKIRDVNDEPPSFNKREYVIQIPENISEGSPLPGLDMIVTDPDEVSDLKVKNRVECWFFRVTIRCFRCN